MKNLVSEFLCKFPLLIRIAIFLIFFLSLIFIFLGVLLFFLTDSFDNAVTFLMGFLTFGIVGVVGSISYTINYWVKEKHQLQNANIEYLKTVKEDVNNYLTHLESLKKQDFKEKTIKNVRTKSGKWDIHDQEENHYYGSLENPINYLYEINTKITNILGKILSGEKTVISSEEILELRTNTFEDFKYISKEILNKNIKADWFKGKNFNFHGIDLAGYEFRKVDMSGSSFHKTVFSETIFYGCNLQFADFSNSSIYSLTIDFEGLNLLNSMPNPKSLDLFKEKQNDISFILENKKINFIEYLESQNKALKKLSLKRN